MSKKKKRKNKKSLPSKKKKSYKSLIITLAVVLILGAVIAVSCIITYNSSPESAGIVKTFTCSKAYNASGDEVELGEVYNLRYDNYQGSMTLNNDYTFTFWMTPGAKDDGLHGGSYTYDKDKDIINATFGSGEKVKFKIARNPDGQVNHIEVPYQGYKVYMS